MTRSYVRRALEGVSDLGADVEIVEAASGFDALRLLPRASYDLIITDVNMPNINGLELLRFVRQSAHLRDIAVLVMSSQASDRDRQRGIELGADGFLPKPFTPEALRDAVTKSLSARRPDARPGGSQR